VEGTLGVAAGVLRVTPESADEEQPYHHRSGAVAVFDGRLDNRAELVSTLPSNEVPGDAPDVALVAEAYATWGDRFPERLNGEFALAILDPRSGSALLARDAVGTVSLLFARTTAGDVIFASEAKALLRHPLVINAPNVDVLAEYLLGGNARADRWDSFFSDVCRVPPGVTVLIRYGGLTWRTHDGFEQRTPTVRRPYGEHVEEYRAHFTAAVTRRLRSRHPVGMFISGGLDSSSILAVAAREAGDRSLAPIHISFPEVGGNEERYVQQLERGLGLKIERVAATSDDFLAATAEQSWMLEAPVASLGWGSRVAGWRLLRERGAKTCLGGHWGDQVLVDQSYLVDLFDELRWGEIKRHLAEYPAWMEGVPRSFFRRTFMEDLIRWHLPPSAQGPARVLRSRLRGAHHEAPWYSDEMKARASAPPRKPLIGGWARPRRGRSLQGRLWTSLTAEFSLTWNGMATSNFGLVASAPFLDRDFLEWLMGLPGEVLMPQGRVKGIHRDAMRGILPEPIRDRRDKGDGTARSNAETIEAIPAIRRLFSEGPRSGRMHLVHPQVVAAYVETLQDGLAEAQDFEMGDVIGRVVALELWLRQLLPEAESGGTHHG
jgi:asparagine synthase (glutamine-hydrolysing)